VVKPASFLSASPRDLAVAASSAEAGPIKQTRRHARQRSGQGFDLLQLLSPANGADPAAIVIDAAMQVITRGPAMRRASLKLGCLVHCAVAARQGVFE